MKTMKWMAGFFCLAVAIVATVSANILTKPSAWQWVVPLTPDELLDN